MAQVDEFDALLQSFGQPVEAPETQGQELPPVDNFDQTLSVFDGELGAPATDFSNIDFTPIPREVEGEVVRPATLRRGGAVEPTGLATAATSALVGTGAEAEQATQGVERTLYMTQQEFSRARDAGTLAPNTRVNIISPEEKELMDKGVEVDKPVNALTRFKIGWFGAGREDVKREVTSRLLNSDVVSMDGNMVRLVPQPDGSKKPMLVNELGASGQDLAEFAGEELLPFFLGGATATVTGATGGALTRSRVVGGISAALGDAAGVFMARNAQLEMAKKAGLVDEGQFPTEEIWTDFSSPAAKESMIGLVGVLGIGGALQFTSTMYKLSSGKALPEPTVEHLRNVLTEFEKVNAEKIQPWRMALSEGLEGPKSAPKGPTVGQATGDDFILNIEARAKELKQDPSSFTTDPFRKVETRDALAKSVSDYVQRKYGEFSGDETIAQAESLLLANLRRPHEDMIESIGSLKQSVDKVITQRVERMAGRAPTSQDLIQSLRSVAKDTRDQIDVEFADRYSQVAAKYKGLSGPNTELADLKKSLSEEQQQLLETFAKGTRAKFLREGAEGDVDLSKAFVGAKGDPLFFVGEENLIEKTMRPGATLKYEEVDATLKALRAKRRQMKDSGADATGPDIATLDRLIGAYKAQRLSIAEKADDAGKMLDQTDTALAVAKGQVDNRVVREIMKTTNGSFDRQAENAAEYIFRPSKSPLASTTGDVTGQLMAIVRKDPQLLSKFRTSVSDIYAKRVSSLAEHKEFMQEYGGIVQDAFGEAPRTLKAMKGAFEKSEELGKKMEAATKALQEETLLKASPGRIIERVLETGTIEEQSKVLKLVEDSPELKRLYLRTYLGGLLTGSVAGKGKGVLRIDDEGNRYFDVGRLREIAGVRGDISAHQDPVFRQLVDPNTKKLLEDTIEIVEMTNRGVKMSETEKYRKSVWAHAIQLYLGPLTKGTRFSNTADIYLQREAGRSLVKALTDPDEFRKLVKSYEPTTKTAITMRRSAMSLLSREFGYGDSTEKTMSDDTFFKDLLSLTPTAGAAEASVSPSEAPQEEVVQPPSGDENVRQGAAQGDTGGDGRVKPVSQENIPKEEPVGNLTPTDNAAAATTPGALNRDAILTEIKRRAASQEAFQ